MKLSQAVVGLLVFLYLKVGLAFTLVGTDPNMRGWNGKTLKFRINESSCTGHDIRGALEDAVDLWNSVPSTYLKIALADETTSTNYSAPPTIYCDAAFGAGLSAGADPDFVPAGGLVSFSNGRIVTGVLILNINVGANANIDNFSKTQLSVVFAHEIGHILGLGHSEDSSSLMYFDASAKAELALAQDDINGISYLYPRNELDGDTLLACGSVQNDSSAGGYWGGFFTLIFFLPLFYLILKRIDATKVQSGALQV